jgi:hypothetical protein
MKFYRDQVENGLVINNLNNFDDVSTGDMQIIRICFDEGTIVYLVPVAASPFAAVPV